MHTKGVGAELRDNLLYGSVVQQKGTQTSMKNMYRDVGMAVPKTTQTRYMDGSVQATQMTTQVTPSLHHFFKQNVYLSFVVRVLETALGG